MVTDDSEDNIWEYKSVGKFKKKTAKSSAKIASEVEKKHAPSKAKSVVKKKSKTNIAVSAHGKKGKGICPSTPKDAKTKFDGNCPLCKMPYRILLGQSPRWHLAECRMEKSPNKPPCPHGLRCNSGLPNHFQRFCHKNATTDVKCSLITLSDEDDIEFKSEKKGNTFKKKLEFTNENSSKEIESTKENSAIGIQENILEPQGAKHTKRKSDQFLTDSKRFNEENRDNESLQANDSNRSSLRISIDSVWSMNKTESNFLEPTDDYTEPVEASGRKSISPDIFEMDNCDNQYFNGFHDYQSVKNNIDTGNQNSEPEEEGNVSFNNYNALDNQTVIQNGANNKSESDLTAESLFRNSLTITTTKMDVNDESSNCSSVNLNPDVSKSAEDTDIKSEIKDADYELAVKNVDKSTVFTKVLSSQSTQSTLHSFFNIPKSVKSDNAKEVPVKGRKSRSSSAAASSVSQRSSGSSTSMSSNSIGSLSQPAKKGTRQCPFYKRLPGTNFTVDAFYYGIIPNCSSYFLSHFHYDHYRGLKKDFKQPIYCCEITGNLVKKMVKVDSKYINILPMNKVCCIDGVDVTLLEANHCPGAVMFLFKLKDGKTYLHTGDFRADPKMELYPELIDLHVHQLYLDTTYCDPQYAFPPQQFTINSAALIASTFVLENPKTLVVVGSYTLGKERIFLAIANILDSKICVTTQKTHVLNCMNDENLRAKITSNGNEAQVHVQPMKMLNYKSLEQYLQRFKNFNKILAFEPTGWTHTKTKSDGDSIKPKINSNNITVYGIPYSEHSSFEELKRFVQFIRPDRILPTVNNGNPAARQKMTTLFDSWLNETS